MLERQKEIAHARRKLTELCPFCGEQGAQLWYDPMNADYMEPYQVRCSCCGARGPNCDCGEESAVPAWLSVQRIQT